MPFAGQARLAPGVRSDRSAASLRQRTAIALGERAGDSLAACSSEAPARVADRRGCGHRPLRWDHDEARLAASTAARIAAGSVVRRRRVAGASPARVDLGASPATVAPCTSTASRPFAAQDVLAPRRAAPSGIEASCDKLGVIGVPARHRERRTPQPSATRKLGAPGRRHTPTRSAPPVALKLCA